MMFITSGKRAPLKALTGKAVVFCLHATSIPIHFHIALLCGSVSIHYRRIDVSLYLQNCSYASASNSR